MSPTPSIWHLPWHRRIRVTGCPAHCNALKLWRCDRTIGTQRSVRMCLPRRRCGYSGECGFPHVSNRQTMPSCPLSLRIDALPLGRFEDLNSEGLGFDDDYLDPYERFINSPFVGNVTDSAVPGFNPPRYDRDPAPCESGGQHQEDHCPHARFQARRCRCANQALQAERGRDLIDYIDVLDSGAR